MVWLGLVAIVSFTGGAVLAWAWLALRRGFQSGPKASPPALGFDPLDRPNPPFQASRDGGLRIDPLLILRQAVERARPAALAARVTLLSPDPAGGFAIAAPPHDLAEVLDILLSRAIRHNRPGGVVLVELRQTADGLEVRVRDTGHGFDPDALSRLLQADMDAMPDLPRARRLARAMGGRMIAASAPGQGSTFTLCLPGAAPDERRASPASSAFLLSRSRERA